MTTRRAKKRDPQRKILVVILQPGYIQIYVVFAKKGIIKYQGKKVAPKTIATNEASDTIKEAAKTKDLELYAEIKDLDLIAKEFKYHEHCRKNFTRKRKRGETVSIKFMVLS